jgi:hypothetical protein
VNFFADENPDTAGQPSGDAAEASGGDAETGSIASLDDALADAADDEKPDARSDTTKTPDGKPADEPPPALILGKYKTPEDVIAAHQELERKFHEISMENANLKKPAVVTPPTEEWVELTGEQLATLETNDKEAYAWYVKEHGRRETAEAIEKVIKPLKDQLAPLNELKKQDAANKFVSQENAIVSQTKNMFGPEYEALDKQRQSVEFLQKRLFPTIPKPLADAILFHNEKGSPEYARQLLLGQIQIYNLRQNAGKRKASINADVGSAPGNPRPKDRAATLDEAGELAANELGMK